MLLWRPSFLVILLLLVAAASAFSQPELKRGIIRVRKTAPKTYHINRQNSLYQPAKIKVFTVRAFGCTFKEYFPEGYTSDIFPLVFNNAGLILVNEKRKWLPGSIYGYQYELCLGNINCGMLTSVGNGSEVIGKLKRMPKGSAVWVRNLSYTDGQGKLHENEVGEFKIEKIN